MDAHKAIITNIFNNSTLIEVPFFQRAYVWNEDLWERFLDDMEYVTKVNKPHFLGSIILKEEKVTDKDAAYASCFTVIDGQQRLTTYLIFLKALCLKANDQHFDIQFRINEEEIALRHGRSDIEAFNEVTSLKVAKEIDNKHNSRIIDAYNYFYKWINLDKLERKTIIKNIQFVKIELDKDEDEQQIFDSLNSLGVSLTTSELLKNYFFNRQTEKEYELIWVDTFEKDNDIKAYWDQEIETGRTKRAMIDIFFDSFFQLFIQDKKYSISAEDRISYDRLDQLAQSYQHFINNYCNEDKNIVLSQIKEYAKCFMQNFQPSYCDMGVSKQSGIERLNIIIFGLKNTTMLPYVLYIAKNVVDKDEFNKMCGIIESYIMRRMVVHASTKNYNRLFSSLILNSVTDAKSLKERLQKMSDATTYVPSDEELLNGFMESKLANLQTKGIIYLLESSIRPDNSSTSLLGFSQYSLEHLMPKKWRNNWEQCEPEEARQRDSKLLTLGNLAIITQSLNASIRDSDWKTKKNGNGINKPGLDLSAAGIYTMHDVLQKEDWNVIDINCRAEWLYNNAKRVWDIVPDYEGQQEQDESLNSNEGKSYNDYLTEKDKNVKDSENSAGLKIINDRSKLEIRNYLYNKGIKLPENSNKWTLARLQENDDTFWMNPNKELLKENWNIVLNNQVEKELIVIIIPENTFSYKVEDSSQGFFVRRDIPYRLDLYISKNDLSDKKTGISLQKYVVSRILY